MSRTHNDYLANEELDSELIVGLVCAVGTEKNLAITLLQERLGLAGYRVEVVKISRDVIPQLAVVSENNSDKFQRYSDLMDAGNQCRELGNENHPPDDAILALGAATVISTRRSLEAQGEAKGSEQKDTVTTAGPGPLPKTAFIIDSLKRPEEVEKLRIIYPSGFVLLGIHQEEELRRRHLVDDEGMSDDQANQLLRRDSEESKVKHGQRVNATFHLADFFVRLTDDRTRLRYDIKRIVELWFGNPFVTPTFDEHAMFFAFAAALRSADLSRQVGAVIARDSQIVSTGANECPKAGGGLYWPVDYESGSGSGDSTVGVGCARDVPKGRDYTRADGDSNRAQQLRMIDQIIEEADESPLGDYKDQLRELLEKSGIRDLTEFGRVVHAEMEALLGCARNGISTLGATLYCTTFPCHNCAKHIVAAGIKRVVYVEPYPKSKALSHHDDSIVASGIAPVESSSRVLFEPFVGVGPRRFFELFSMNLGSSYALVRKDRATGKRKDWRIENAQLRLQMKPVSYLDLELMACESFGEKLSLTQASSLGGNEEAPPQ